MNKQSLIDCLETIKHNVQCGNAKAALLNLNKLEHCIMQCECPAIPDHSGYPAIRKPAYENAELGNQCDGCRQGLPVIAGLHRTPEDRPFMACTKQLYKHQSIKP